MDLTNRIAVCTYGGHAPVASSPTLAFFEYRGVGSEYGNRNCKNCNYYDTAHSSPRNKCEKFEPVVSSEHDRYYCGCYGWD